MPGISGGYDSRQQLTSHTRHAWVIPPANQSFMCETVHLVVRARTALDVKMAARQADSSVAAHGRWVITMWRRPKHWANHMYCSCLSSFSADRMT